MVTLYVFGVYRFESESEEIDRAQAAQNINNNVVSPNHSRYLIKEGVLSEQVNTSVPLYYSSARIIFTSVTTSNTFRVPS